MHFTFSTEAWKCQVTWSEISKNYLNNVPSMSNYLFLERLYYVNIGAILLTKRKLKKK